jgi:menaquinone-specific isochorismate synthase
VEIPVLTVRTVAVSDPGRDPSAMLEHTDPIRPAAFIRDGEGIVGLGERLRVAAHGPDRVARLAASWRDVVARADIVDAVTLPGTGLVAFGSIAFADASPAESVLVVPSLIVGRRDGVAWVTTIQVAGADAASPAPRAIGPAPHADLRPGGTSPERFLDAVAAATAAIRDGRVDKVVLARDLVGRIGEGDDRRGILQRLAERYPSTSVFAVDGLLGASPETLVRVRGGDARCRVLAGTAARWADDATDAHAASSLAASPKNRGEHELAVRSVLTALAPHATTVEHSPAPFPLRLPNLWHLATDVHATLRPGRTCLDLVAALHPTAAVAGTPTDAAVALIAELEPADRGRYAGPVGWIDATGDGEWAIALRCATVTPDGAVTAWAGAGIVGDSEPERELEETNLKFRPVVDALG